MRVVRVAEEVSGHVVLKPYPKSKAGRRFSALPPDLPTLLVAGNHDLTAPLAAASARHGHPSSLNSTVDIGGLRLIGIDSHIDHDDEGLLAPDALAYADAPLASAAGPVGEPGGSIRHQVPMAIIDADQHDDTDKSGGTHRRYSVYRGFSRTPKTEDGSSV